MNAEANSSTHSRPQNVVEIPILVTAFNRPDTTEELFKRLSQFKPKKIYFSVDGPRSTFEIEKVEMTKDVINLVDWPCEVFTKFNSQNKGCASAVVDAITWSLENEDFIVVLEDDILPSADFFLFMNYFLTLEKLDKKYLSVTGVSQEHSAKCHTYRATKFAQSWGWGITKVSWMNFLESYQSKKYFLNSFDLFWKLNLSFRSLLFFRYVIFKLKKNELDSWAYPFLLYGLKFKKPSIMSNFNLIQNIGIGDSATHSKHLPGYLSKVEPFTTEMTMCGCVDSMRSDKKLRLEKYSFNFSQLINYLKKHPRY